MTTIIKIVEAMVFPVVIYRETLCKAERRERGAVSGSTRKRHQKTISELGFIAFSTITPPHCDPQITVMQTGFQITLGIPGGCNGVAIELLVRN